MESGSSSSECIVVDPTPTDSSERRCLRNASFLVRILALMDSSIYPGRDLHDQYAALPKGDPVIPKCVVELELVTSDAVDMACTESSPLRLLNGFIFSSPSIQPSFTCVRTLANRGSLSVHWRTCCAVTGEA